MAIAKPQFEVSDTRGSTVHYNGTATTTPVAIPGTPDKIISEFWIENDINNTPATEKLSFSCDGGVTYTELNLSDSMVWTPKGNVKQIYIKGSSASVLYKMIVNYEEHG